jgi:translocation and assembly module TamB
LNLSADARFTWRGWSWEAMNGGGSLQELQLSKTAYNLSLNSPVRITATNGVLESGSGTLEGEDSRIGFHLRGRADGTGLDNSVRGSVSLKVLEFLTPLIVESRGKMKLDLTVGGNVRNAAFRGNIGISEGMLRLSGLEAPVENLEGGLRMADSRLTIDRLTGQLGGGSVQASGWVDLFLNKPPKFAVDLFCADNRIKFFPVNYAEISDAKLSFKGDAPPYLFSGTARFKRLMMRNNFDLGRGKGLQNAKYLPEKVAGVKSFYEVRLRGLADGGIFVDNNLLNAEFSGEVTLMNNFEFPQIVGRASLVRGKLLFRNTAFTLDQAYIRAPNPEVFNPMFSISGVANLDVYRINIYAAGTVDRPKISLSSYPALPQEDIVSLLAFGYRGEDARKINPNDTSAITYSEVGSILLEQLQLSQNLQSKGLKVMVAPAFADTEASIVRPNTAATAAPKVYVQSQVMKNLEAVLGGTVGAAQGQSMDAKMEYHLNRRASVRGVYEQSPSGLDTKETKNSYGADLRFRWEFK